MPFLGRGLFLSKTQNEKLGTTSKGNTSSVLLLEIVPKKSSGIVIFKHSLVGREKHSSYFTCFKNTTGATAFAE